MYHSCFCALNQTFERPKSTVVMLYFDLSYLFQACRGSDEWWNQTDRSLRLQFLSVNLLNGFCSLRFVSFVIDQVGNDTGGILWCQ